MTRKHLTFTMWPLNVRYATKFIEIDTSLRLVVSTIAIYIEKCEMQRTSHQKMSLQTAMFPPTNLFSNRQLQHYVVLIDDSRFGRLPPPCQRMPNDVSSSSDAWKTPPT